MRIIGYVRESTIRQAKFGYNLADQERKIRDYVDMVHEGKQVKLEFYREGGESAKSLKRTQLSKVMKEMETQQVDEVIIYSLDRLSRNICDMYDLLLFFEKTNTTLVSVTEQIDTSTVNGRFFISIIVLIAQWELDMLSTRTKNGQREAFRQGRYAYGGTIPLGYRRSEIDKYSLIVHPEEAVVVKNIFEQIAYKGMSNYTMAVRLRREKVLGRAWVESTVEAIIKNPIYYGALVNPDAEVNIEDFTKGIVSKELWDAANDALKGKKYDRHEYRYKDRVYCEVCGSRAIQVSTLKKSTRLYLYYKCPNCKRSINEKTLTTAIIDDLNMVAKLEEVGRPLINARKKCHEAEVRIESIIYEQIEYGYKDSTVEGITKEYSKKRDEQSVIIKRLEKLLDQTTFRGIPFEKQEELLDRYVQRIYMNPASREGRLEYTEDFERLKNRYENGHKGDFSWVKGKRK